MHRTRNKVSLLAGLALVAGLAASTSQAQSWSDDYEFRGGSNVHSIADGNIVDVQIRVGGTDASLFFRPGTHDRHYFQAFKGRNYSLVVRNTTGRRVGVLIAVDGINVVNGERSRLQRGEPLYVLDPWESAEIKGWRSSMNEVRRFVFVDEERSYATRTGQANGDLGWIRVLGFREVEQRGWLERFRSPDIDDELRSENAPAPSAPYTGKSQAAPQSRKDAGERSMAEGHGQDLNENPGTGWGDRRYDPVQRTNFESERVPSDHLVFRYEYTAGLRALGIVPRRARTFERERGELGFAQPPRR